MVRTVVDSINKNPIIYVLFFSGLIGMLMGFDKAHFQVSVQTGQVIAGFIEYPPDNPNYIYHLKAFSLIAQLSALFMYILHSEILTSYLVSLILGMVILQSLSVLVFSLNKNVYLSILCGLFIYYMGYVGSGVVYPITLLGNMHTFGALGLFFMLLCLGLIGAGAYRVGLFCLALAPSVHPSLAVWLAILILIAMLFHPAFSIKIIKKNYRYFTAGFVVSLLSLSFQLYLMRDIPEGNMEHNREFFNNYIKHWDTHRIMFFWNYAKDSYNFFHISNFICIASSVTALLGMKYFGRKNPNSFMLFIIAVAGPLALILAILTHFPPESLPKFLVMIMPGRFVNLSNLVFAPLVLGIITCHFKGRSRDAYAVLTLILLVWYLFVPYGNYALTILFFSVSLLILLWIMLITLKKSSSLINEEKGPSPLRRPGKIDLALKLSYLILIPLAFMFFSRLYHDVFIDRSFLGDRTNVKIIKELSQRDGMLLVTSHFRLTSLKTRRPVLLAITELDSIAIASEASVKTNKITKKIYGVDLQRAPATEEIKRRRSVSSDMYKELWENRTVNEWQEIMNEFGAKEILTTADWNLNLPVVVADSYIKLYKIPESR